MKSTICDKVVTKSGNAMVVNLTKELKMVGADFGDVVRITIEKI